MRYYPGPHPNDPYGAGAYARRELERFAGEVRQPRFLQLAELHVEPDKPRDGMIVLADGTDWNPGGGAGFYGRYGAAWVKLG